MPRIFRYTTAADGPDAGVVRLITLLAGLASLTIALVVPISCFLVVQARLLGELEIQAQLYAAQVTEEARQNPTLWNALAGSTTEPGLDNLEIARPSDANDHHVAVARRRVFSIAGQALIDTAISTPPSWPLLLVHLPVGDNATHLGAVDVTRSLRPALLFTAAVACGSMGLGLALFLALRVAPLRMLRAALDHASFLSAHDLLTGLPNRRLFHDRLTTALSRARRDGGRIAVFYLDLDRFKIINDLLGHSAGDATLRTVAERLRVCVRASDTLARLGGDEFAIIQPMLRRPEEADMLGQRLLAAIAPAIDLDGQVQHVGVSVGVALSQVGAPEDPEEMMKAADIALYRAKEEGRGRVCFFSPDMDLKLQQRHAMETDLRTAIAEQHLILHYQPQVDLTTGRLLGAEALIRWDRPGYGMVPPDGFIGLAEDTGLIVPIGTWVLHEACRRATTWPEYVGIAVNVSPVQFRHPGLYEAVAEIIRDTGITPSRLELEITEGLLLQDTKQTMATLLRLRELGTRLAMDDFGTGYSSLGYLQKFNFDKIKIDRSFVSRIGRDSNAEAIVRAVIGMAEALGVCTIAEGVETCAQAAMLRMEGCSEGQGFLYSRPISGEAFDALLQQNELVS